MGKSRSKRKKEEPDVIRWVLNLIVPLMTLFGVLNLVVSGEAIEGLYKFFKNTSPKYAANQQEFRTNPGLLSYLYNSFNVKKSNKLEKMQFIRKIIVSIITNQMKSKNNFIFGNHSLKVKNILIIVIYMK